MQRMRVLALCVVVLLAFGGLASANQGFEIKASMLFGTKLDVDDVGNIGSLGKGSMEWELTPADGELPSGWIETLGTPEVEAIRVSSEEEGCPILLEATYGMDKFKIGGFWLGGFKSEGEEMGKVLGFYGDGAPEGALTYMDLEQFLSGALDLDGSLEDLDSMIFFGDENVPVLPGIDYEFRRQGPDNGTLVIKGGNEGNFWEGNEGSKTGPLNSTLLVDPEAGASPWKTDVSFNLSNYGVNVGYKLIEQDNINLAVVAGLEGMSWTEEVYSNATEKYDYRLHSIDDVEYVFDGSVGNWGTLLTTLFSDDKLEDLKELGLLKEDGSGLEEGVEFKDFNLNQYTHMLLTREIDVTRELEFNPYGCSIGASLELFAADNLRVNVAGSFGWFSGDATVKIVANEKRAGEIDLQKNGMARFVDEDGEGEPISVQLSENDVRCWHPTTNYEKLAALFENLDTYSNKQEGEPDDTQVTVMRAQISAEYDVTETVFLGGGFFYSQWKGMPVLSDTDPLGTKNQDIVASGVNVEVGVRF